MKIVYCINSFSPYGGLENTTITKVNALARIPGNLLWIVYTDHSKSPLLPEDSPVNLVNLGINYYKDDWKSNWNIVKGILFKRRLHRKRLKKVLTEIQPDIVISVGHSEKNILPSINGTWQTIREIHNTKNYRWLSARTLFERIIACLGDFIDYHWWIWKYDRIVVLTNEDKERYWKNNERISVIPNPVRFFPNTIASLNSKRIIAAGRLTYQKNYSSLIHAYSLIANRYPGWRLDIFGEGPDKKALQEEINSLGLTKVISLKGNSSNLQQEMLASSIFVLTSIYEGFGLVITEAMSCGLPVISYSCPCGPKDIIENRVNGFLVNNGDERTFAEHIACLIENEDLRKNMGRLARNRASCYLPDQIAKQWMNLFKTIKEERRMTKRSQ